MFKSDDHEYYFMLPLSSLRVIVWCNVVLCLSGSNCLHTCVAYVLCSQKSLPRQVQYECWVTMETTSSLFKMYKHITLSKKQLLLNAEKLTSES